MKKKASKLSSVRIFFTAWTIGFVVGVMVFIFRVFGWIKIEGFDIRRLRKMMENTGKGILFMSNHPSMTETFVIPSLFFPKLFPISTPAIEFYNAWWFALIRPCCIPVVRESKISGGRFIISLSGILNDSRIVVLFPEGGRTYKGEKFKFSSKGKKIRSFKEGILPIFSKSSSMIIPVWIEGGESILPNISYKGKKRGLPFPRLGGKMIVRFGWPFFFNKSDYLDYMDSISYLEDQLLNLSSSSR